MEVAAVGPRGPLQLRKPASKQETVEGVVALVFDGLREGAHVLRSALLAFIEACNYGECCTRAAQAIIDSLPADNQEKLSQANVQLIMKRLLRADENLSLVAASIKLEHGIRGVTRKQMLTKLAQRQSIARIGRLPLQHVTLADEAASAAKQAEEDAHVSRASVSAAHSRASVSADVKAFMEAKTQGQLVQTQLLATALLRFRKPGRFQHEARRVVSLQTMIARDIVRGRRSTSPPRHAREHRSSSSKDGAPLKHANGAQRNLRHGVQRSVSELEEAPSGVESRFDRALAASPRVGVEPEHANTGGAQEHWQSVHRAGSPSQFHTTATLRALVEASAEHDEQNESSAAPADPALPSVVIPLTFHGEVIVPTTALTWFQNTGAPDQHHVYHTVTGRHIAPPVPSCLGEARELAQQGMMAVRKSTAALPSVHVRPDTSVAATAHLRCAVSRSSQRPTTMPAVPHSATVYGPKRALMHIPLSERYRVLQTMRATRGLQTSEVSPGRSGAWQARRGFMESHPAAFNLHSKLIAIDMSHALY